MQHVWHRYSGSDSFWEGIYPLPEVISSFVLKTTFVHCIVQWCVFANYLIKVYLWMSYNTVFFYKYFRWRNKENALDKLESMQWSPPCFLRMFISIPSFQITPAATQIVVFRPVFYTFALINGSQHTCSFCLHPRISSHQNIFKTF